MLKNGASYAGALILEEDTDHQKAKNDMFVGGGPLKLKPAYVFKDTVLQTPQGLGKITQCMPVFDSLGDVQLWIDRAELQSAVFFDELTTDDRDGYKNFVNNTRKQLREAKAKKAGIVVAKGPVRPPEGWPPGTN